VLDESRARLYLRDGATVGEDAYDASRFAPPGSEYAQLSFIGSDQTRWAQLSLPMALSERTEVPLRAEAAGLSGTGVLTVPSQSGMPEGWTVGLVDTKRDTVVALTSETAYRFDLSASKALTEKAEDSGPGGGPQEGAVSGRFRVRVAPSGELPVELAGLEGQATDQGVRLTWRTASEANNAGFQIERRVAEGRADSWREVGFVEGKGTTSRPQSYRFTDADLPYAADAVTYRLRQVDTDGTASIVGETTVERGPVEALELLGTFPNPARSQATVRFAVPEQAEAADVQMRLYDVLGRQVRTVRSSVAPGRHEQSLDVSGLSSGVYVLRLQAEGTSTSRKLTVLR
jgi:hypothetical protein